MMDYDKMSHDKDRFKEILDGNAAFAASKMSKALRESGLKEDVVIYYVEIFTTGYMSGAADTASILNREIQSMFRGR